MVCSVVLNGAGNSLGNKITGNSGINNLSGAAGNDILLGGTGADVLSGGAGSDVFGYGATTDGGAVSTNVSPTSVGVTGDTVSDFVSGTDKFTFLNSAFGNLSTGTLQSANFASINEAYKGEASQISNKSGPVFVFDSIDTLYYDPSTSQAGYTVISTTNLVNVRLATSKLSPHFSSNVFPFFHRFWLAHRLSR